MSSVWRGLSAFSKQWSDFDDEKDLLKRAVICAPVWAAELYGWYYLSQKRRDLAKIQKVALALCGAGYASWTTAFRFLHLRHVQLGALEIDDITYHEPDLVNWVISPMLMYAPTYFAKAAGDDDNKIQIKYVLGSAMYGYGMYRMWNAGINIRDTGDSGYTLIGNTISYFLVMTGWSMFSFNKWLTSAQLLLGSFVAFCFHGVDVSESKKDYRPRPLKPADYIYDDGQAIPAIRPPERPDRGLYEYFKLLV